MRKTSLQNQGAAGDSWLESLPLLQDPPENALMLAARVAQLPGALVQVASRLKAGVVADLLSKPVLVGYLTGAALILISTQLGKLVGIKLAGHNFFSPLAELFRRIHETHVLPMLIGAALAVLLEWLRRFAPKIPAALVVVALALGVSAVFNFWVGIRKWGRFMMRQEVFTRKKSNSVMPSTRRERRCNSFCAACRQK